MELVLASHDDERLERFYRGIYWEDFAEQHEPIEAWRAALRGERPYELRVKLAVEGDQILGGITYERYPRSGCGLVTYVVVAKAARGSRLGKRLRAEATQELFAAGAPAVFGENNDPRATTREPVVKAWERLVRNQRWGSRVLDLRYVQPALGAGLQRDRGLVLLALAGEQPLGEWIDGAIVRAFVEELYATTEGGPPDPEIVIGERVRLCELLAPAAL